MSAVSVPAQPQQRAPQANTVRFAPRASEPLSMLSPHPVRVHDTLFRTCEHFYLASKFPRKSAAHRRVVQSATVPHARHEAHTAWRELSGGQQKKWRHRREEVMVRAAVAKFTQHASAREVLLASGDAQLVYDSDHPLWGLGSDGHGQNLAGRILMGVRAFVQAHPGFVWDGVSALRLPSVPGCGAQGKRRKDQARTHRTVVNTARCPHPYPADHGDEDEGEEWREREALEYGLILCADCREQSATRRDPSDGFCYCTSCWDHYYQQASNRATPFDNEVDRILAHSETDHLSVLGLEGERVRGHMAEVLKRARVRYRTLSLAVHPDKCAHPDATAAFARLRKAMDFVEDNS